MWVQIRCQLVLACLVCDNYGVDLLALAAITIFNFKLLMDG